jgi:hypothetical protein
MVPEYQLNINYRKKLIKCSTFTFLGAAGIFSSGGQQENLLTKLHLSIF